MNEGYSTVFVSLDGTEQQDFVLARAIKVAANNDAKLIIGHVIDSTALESAGSYPVDLINGLEEAFRNRSPTRSPRPRRTRISPRSRSSCAQGASARP